MNFPIHLIRLLSVCLVCLGFGLGNAQATDKVTNPEAADVAAETPAESASTTSQPITPTAAAAPDKPTAGSPAKPTAKQKRKARKARKKKVRRKRARRKKAGRKARSKRQRWPVRRPKGAKVGIPAFGAAPYAPGERLLFQVKMFGSVAGEAILAVGERTRFNGKSALPLVGFIRSGEFLNKFYPVNDRMVVLVEEDHASPAQD